MCSEIFSSGSGSGSGMDSMDNLVPIPSSTLTDVPPSSVDDDDIGETFTLSSYGPTVTITTQPPSSTPPPTWVWATVGAGVVTAFAVFWWMLVCSSLINIIIMFYIVSVVLRFAFFLEQS